MYWGHGFLPGSTLGTQGSLIVAWSLRNSTGACLILSVDSFRFGQARSSEIDIG